MRAIRGRTSRYAASNNPERSEAVPPRDTEGGSPRTPVRRAGRGEIQPLYARLNPPCFFQGKLTSCSPDPL